MSGKRSIERVSKTNYERVRLLNRTLTDCYIGHAAKSFSVVIGGQEYLLFTVQSARGYACCEETTGICLATRKIKAQAIHEAVLWIYGHQEEMESLLLAQPLAPSFKEVEDECLRPEST